MFRCRPRRSSMVPGTGSSGSSPATYSRSACRTIQVMVRPSRVAFTCAGPYSVAGMRKYLPGSAGMCRVPARSGFWSVLLLS